MSSCDHLGMFLYQALNSKFYENYHGSEIISTGLYYVVLFENVTGVCFIEPQCRNTSDDMR